MSQSLRQSSTVLHHFVTMHHLNRIETKDMSQFNKLFKAESVLISQTRLEGMVKIYPQLFKIERKNPSDLHPDAFYFYALQDGKKPSALQESHFQQEEVDTKELEIAAFALHSFVLQYPLQRIELVDLKHFYSKNPKYRAMIKSIKLQGLESRFPCLFRIERKNLNPNPDAFFFIALHQPNSPSTSVKWATLGNPVLPSPEEFPSDFMDLLHDYITLNSPQSQIVTAELSIFFEKYPQIKSTLKGKISLMAQKHPDRFTYEIVRPGYHVLHAVPKESILPLNSHPKSPSLEREAVRSLHRFVLLQPLSKISTNSLKDFYLSFPHFQSNIRELRLQGLASKYSYLFRMERHPSVGSDFLYIHAIPEKLASWRNFSQSKSLESVALHSPEEFPSDFMDLLHDYITLNSPQSQIVTAALSIFFEKYPQIKSTLKGKISLMAQKHPDRFTYEIVRPGYHVLHANKSNRPTHTPNLSAPVTEPYFKCIDIPQAGIGIYLSRFGSSIFSKALGDNSFYCSVEVIEPKERENWKLKLKANVCDANESAITPSLQGNEESILQEAFFSVQESLKEIQLAHVTWGGHSRWQLFSDERVQKLVSESILIYSPGSPLNEVVLNHPAQWTRIQIEKFLHLFPYSLTIIDQSFQCLEVDQVGSTPDCIRSRFRINHSKAISLLEILKILYSTDYGTSIKFYTPEFVSEQSERLETPDDLGYSHWIDESHSLPFQIIYQASSTPKVESMKEYFEGSSILHFRFELLHDPLSNFMNKMWLLKLQKESMNVPHISIIEYYLPPPDKVSPRLHICFTGSKQSYILVQEIFCHFFHSFKVSSLPIPTIPSQMAIISILYSKFFECVTHFKVAKNQYESNFEAIPLQNSSILEYIYFYPSPSSCTEMDSTSPDCCLIYSKSVPKFQFICDTLQNILNHFGTVVVPSSQILKFTLDDFSDLGLLETLASKFCIVSAAVLSGGADPQLQLTGFHVPMNEDQFSPALIGQGLDEAIQWICEVPNEVEINISISISDIKYRDLIKLPLHSKFLFSLKDRLKFPLKILQPHESDSPLTLFAINGPNSLVSAESILINQEIEDWYGSIIEANFKILCAIDSNFCQSEKGRTELKSIEQERSVVIITQQMITPQTHLWYWFGTTDDQQRGLKEWNLYPQDTMGLIEKAMLVEKKTEFELEILFSETSHISELHGTPRYKIMHVPGTTPPVYVQINLASKFVRKLKYVIVQPSSYLKLSLLGFSKDVEVATKQVKNMLVTLKHTSSSIDASILLQDGTTPPQAVKILTEHIQSISVELTSEANSLIPLAVRFSCFDETTLLRSENQVHQLLQSTARRLLEESQRIVWPSDWPNKAYNPAQVGYTYEPVTRGSAEYLTVKSIFRNRSGPPKTINSRPDSTFTNRISAIKRIQNPKVWFEYYSALKKLAVQNSLCAHGDIFLKANEIWMKHGTRTNSVDSISQTGLDSRYCENGYYGRAAYTAEDAAYSHQFRFSLPQPGYAAMLIVRVAAGKIFEVTNRCEEHTTFRTPPIGFDSVRGPVTNIGEMAVMVYSHDRCYPAYVIEYRV